MMKIGITGQNGFIGYHLYNTLRLFKEEFIVLEFDRSFFFDETKLDEFVSQCDVIVHLAALNRNISPKELYQTNIDLVKRLIDSFERTQCTPHVLIASSIQEMNDTSYGKSKKEGRLLLSNWANQYGGRLSGLIIPNTFGPFGKPYYNSVIATFCHQISHNETPRIDVDGELKLIYVGELVDQIVKVIRENDNSHELPIAHTAKAKVSEILNHLMYFREIYQDKGEFPKIKNDFEHKLFNTYRCYMDVAHYFPRKFKLNTDNRGTFVEVARHRIAGQTSFSTTVPGITRGNHFHTRKIERFAVINGKALIQLRRIGTDEVYDFFIDGDEPAYVDMPIWYTHNIKNIGKNTLFTIFWINEPYNESNPDTYFEQV